MVTGTSTSPTNNQRHTSASSANKDYSSSMRNQNHSGTRSSSRLRKRPYELEGMENVEDNNNLYHHDPNQLLDMNNEDNLMINLLNQHHHHQNTYQHHQHQQHHQNTIDNTAASIAAQLFAAASNHQLHNNNNINTNNNDHESYYQQLQQQQYYQTQPIHHHNTNIHSNSHSPHVHNDSNINYHNHHHNTTTTLSSSARTSPNSTRTQPQVHRDNSNTDTSDAAYLLAMAANTNNAKRMRPDGSYIDNILPGLPTPSDNLDRATSMGVIINNGNTDLNNPHNTSPHLAPINDGLQRQLSAFSMAMLPEVANSLAHQSTNEIANVLNGSATPMDRMMSASSTSAIGALTAMATMVMPEHMNSATSVNTTSNSARTSPLTSPSGTRTGPPAQRGSGGSGGRSQTSPLTSPNTYRTNGMNPDGGFSSHYNNNMTHYHSTSPTTMYTQAGLMGPPSAGLDLGRATSVGLSSILMDNNTTTLSSQHTSPNNNGLAPTTSISPNRAAFTTSRPVSGQGNNQFYSSNQYNNSSQYNPPPMLQISTSFTSLAEAAERESSLGYQPNHHNQKYNDDNNSVLNTPQVDSTPLVA